MQATVSSRLINPDDHHEKPNHLSRTQFCELVLFGWSLCIISGFAFDYSSFGYGGELHYSWHSPTQKSYMCKFIFWIKNIQHISRKLYLEERTQHLMPAGQRRSMYRPGSLVVLFIFTKLSPRSFFKWCWRRSPEKAPSPGSPISKAFYNPQCTKQNQHKKQD